VKLALRILTQGALIDGGTNRGIDNLQDELCFLRLDFQHSVV
jgi:hypothetical protein